MRIKHRAAAEQLRAAIQAGEWAPGEALPSEVELAARLGVHRLTLRKALAALADEGLVWRQQGRGTFARPGAASDGTPALLFVRSCDEAFGEVLHQALTAAAQRDGWAALSLTTAAAGALTVAEQAHLERLLPLANAVICQAGSAALLRPWLGARPLVVVDPLGRAVDDGSAPPHWRVSGDDRTAARLATLHLAALGHRRIAYVGPAQVPDGRPHPAHTTWRGYGDGLLEAGLRSELVVGLPTGTDDWQATGDAAVREALGRLRPRPTAFVCDADFRASNVLRAAGTLGWRAPDDFSVVGIFNTPWCDMLSPPLTSVSVEPHAQAELALLLARRPAPATTTHLRVAPRLVPRGSCGPPHTPGS